MKILTLLILVSGCSHLSKGLTKADGTPPAQFDSTHLPWTDLEDQDTHLLVDTQVPDEEISKNSGEDIDKEVAVEASSSPRPFLKKVKTKRVQFWIDYFASKQRERFQRFLNNGAAYRPIIDKILDAEGLPRELFFVGLIESGYYLGAHSRASAVGPWQFIRGTGHRYGLVINNDLDERRDIFKATQAAAQYFKDLNNIFSSWELALAAYNAGEYGMIRRIQQHKTRDYYVLSRQRKLPAETINYVPKVLAAMYVYENAKKFGFHIPKAADAFWEKTKMVNAPRNSTLKALAVKMNLSEEVLVKLNPELKRARTPSRYPGVYQLRVPADKNTEWMETFVAETPSESNRIKEIEALRDRVENPDSYPVAAPRIVYTHRVQRGDNLTYLAKKYRLTVSQLARMNGLNYRSQIRIGQVLKVGQRQPVASAPAQSTITVGAHTHTVRSGENLYVIAKKYGMKLRDLALANNLTIRSQVRIGQTLKIGQDESKTTLAPTPTPAKASIPSTHKVSPGESLYFIAKKYGMKLRDLALANNLTIRSQVRIGQTIKLAPNTTQQVQQKVSEIKAAPKKPIVYRLKSGETITDVAKWFGKDVQEIKKENSISKAKTLHVGTPIVIPQTNKGTYTVKRGDYLLKIAEKFNLNQTAIMKLNDLRNSKVYPGQKLVVNLE